MPFLADSIVSTFPLPHHRSVRALWDHKWRRVCATNSYPFYYAHLEDMDPIIDDLERAGISDAYSDAWTETFLPHMRQLEARAQKAEEEGNLDTAQELYLRGSSIGMIARFPVIGTSSVRRSAWTLQKSLYERGTAFWPAPVRNVIIPHTHAAKGDGDSIELYVRRPSSASSDSSAQPIESDPAPVLLTFCGLDAYRPDCPPIISDHASSLGFACVNVEIPGTGDSPASPADPTSAERQLSSILDWIKAQPDLDEGRVLARGQSTGGYNAFRAAHTHAGRLATVIAQGGPSDLAFSKEWLDHVDGGEYPVNITEALRTKLGFASVEEMKASARDRFSLVSTGVFDQPCTKLVVLNGMDDTVFPIEDSIAALQHGSIKSARFFLNTGHMGRPDADQSVKQVISEFLDNANNSSEST